VKQWKVALFLAILGAIAAPFVTHTVKMRPTTQTWIPLTQDEKERISAEMSKTSNPSVVCLDGKNGEFLTNHLRT
jgi:hypothetical protein